MLFKLTPPAYGEIEWTETVIPSFDGAAINRDGAYRYASLIADNQGAPCGTTYGGPVGCYQTYSGCGTIFKLIPPVQANAGWTETVLYGFTPDGDSGSDGAFPLAGLLADHMTCSTGRTIKAEVNARASAQFSR